MPCKVTASGQSVHTKGKIADSFFYCLGLCDASVCSGHLFHYLNPDSSFPWKDTYWQQNYVPYLDFSTAFVVVFDNILDE